MKLKSLLLIFLLSGCDLAKRCADNYPCFESITVRLDTIAFTDTIEYTDVFVYLDTTECPPSAEPLTVIKTVEKTIPSRTITKTIYINRDSTIVVRDLATEKITADSIVNHYENKLKGAESNKLLAGLGWAAAALLVILLLLLNRKK